MVSRLRSQNKYRRLLAGNIVSGSLQEISIPLRNNYIPSGVMKFIRLWLSRTVRRSSRLEVAVDSEIER